jgi:hypothetical protein
LHAIPLSERLPGALGLSSQSPNAPFCFAKKEYKMLVTLPNDLKLILTPFVAFLVTEGLKALGALFGVDLSGRAAAVTAAVAGALFFFADSLLARIPPEGEAIANGALAFLVVILSAYGIHRTAVRFGGNL